MTGEFDLDAVENSPSGQAQHAHCRRAQHLDRARRKLSLDLAVCSCLMPTAFPLRRRSAASAPSCGLRLSAALDRPTAPHGGQVPNFSLYLCAPSRLVAALVARCRSSMACQRARARIVDVRLGAALAIDQAELAVSR